MAAELITLPFRPVINTRGVLEPGALLDVFQSGTTTRVSVFADADLSAPLTNPVVADAAGVFPTVYFDNSAAVRVRVRQANGSVLGDADPYYSDGLSSTDLSFLQSGSGAVTRTVQAKLRETVSASDFSTVQQAFTRARTVGADVVFPAGTYAISSALTLDYTGQTEEPVTQPLGVNITGSGAHNTIINRSGSGFAIESTGGTGVASHIYTVTDGLSLTGASAKGIKLKNHAFTTLRNMTFQGLVTGLELESVLSCKFENLVFGNATNGV